MTLTELKYIVAVAREKHFGKAAEACFVSQPTLSVAIKKLEEELEVKLFERSATEVTVTPLGGQIVQQAQSVLEQAASIREIAKRGKDPLSGPLNLGIIYTIGPYLLPDLVRSKRGLVLTVGATGSGKSTTLAALINWRNENCSDHIVTIEDPIEFLHTNKRSIVNQREVGLDTRCIRRDRRVGYLALQHQRVAH